jgi:hypothetical protein
LTRPHFTPFSLSRSPLSQRPCCALKPTSFQYLELKLTAPHHQARHSSLEVSLPTHDLGRVDGLHLVHPSRSGNNLPDGTHLIRGVTRDTDVVVALEHVLDVADVELGRVAQLGELACTADNVVDKIVGKLENSLYLLMGVFMGVQR